jgi:hypothetical protein
MHRLEIQITSNECRVPDVLVMRVIQAFDRQLDVNSLLLPSLASDRALADVESIKCTYVVKLRLP